MLGGCSQGHGDIAGHLIPGDGNDARVTYGTVGEDGYIGGTASDIHQADTQIPLVTGDHGETRGQLFKDDAIHLQATTMYTLLDVLCRVYGTGHQVHLRFQAHAGHTQGLLNASLVIDHVFLGQDVQHLLIGGDGHRLGRIEHPVHVGGNDFTLPDRDDAVGIH